MLIDLEYALYIALGLGGMSIAAAAWILLRGDKPR
jgi:hypothetical protein